MILESSARPTTAWTARAALRSVSRARAGRRRQPPRRATSRAGSCDGSERRPPHPTHVQAAAPPGLAPVLPRAGLVVSEKGPLVEVLCKPKILPLKSVTLQKLEELEVRAWDTRDAWHACMARTRPGTMARTAMSALAPRALAPSLPRAQARAAAAAAQQERRPGTGAAAFR